MKKFSLSTISLMLSIILWGTLLGGIAYSHLVYFPVYLSALPDSAVVVNGPYGLHEETFWMLIHPLLILSLVVSLALNWKSFDQFFQPIDGLGPQGFHFGRGIRVRQLAVLRDDLTFPRALR